MHMLESGLSDSHRFVAEDFQFIGDYFFDRYLMDDFCNKVMRTMQIEQYENERVRKLFLHWMIDEHVRFQSKVFSALMKAGSLPEADSKYYAVRFYAPILYYAQKWLFSGESDEEKKTAFRADAYAHIQHFCGRTVCLTLSLQEQDNEADTELETYRDVFEVDYYGALRLVKRVVPYMVKQNRGRILFTSSGVGVTGFMNISPYSSTKGALESLAKCLRLEYEKHSLSYATASTRKYS